MLGCATCRTPGRVELLAAFAETPLHPIADWGRQRFGGSDVSAEKRLADLENLLALVKLDPVENAALLAPLLDIPLPPERVMAEELQRRQLAALTSLVMTGTRAQPAVLAARSGPSRPLRGMYCR